MAVVHAHPEPTATVPVPPADLRRARGENFTVVSWLLPRGLAPHFAAVYGFCRTVDDLGDEGPPAGRLAALDAFAADCDRAFGAGDPAHPALRALVPTIRAHGLERDWCARLIEANRIDQRTTRYLTFGELRHYCDHSATPVGRMVLALLGHRDAARGRLADATCTALQLANFWQDVAVDFTKGRVYVPLEDFARFGYAVEDLAAGVADDRWRAVLRLQIARTRALFAEGAPLADACTGRARLDVGLFTAGGRAICDAVEAAGYDVFRRRPVLSRGRKAWLMARAIAALTWREPCWWRA